MASYLMTTIFLVAKTVLLCVSLAMYIPFAILSDLNLVEVSPFGTCNEAIFCPFKLNISIEVTKVLLNEN